MRRSRFSEEQIIGVLKEVEAGIPVGEVCRKHGVCDQTCYRWKAKYGGLEVSEARRSRRAGLEDENRRLKQRVADLTLDIQALKAVVSIPQSGTDPAERDEAVGVMRQAPPELSERRACELARVGRSSYRYERQEQDEVEL